MKTSTKTIAGASRASQTGFCAHTRLTKPECHCPHCLYEQMRIHGPGAKRAESSAALRAATSA